MRAISRKLGSLLYPPCPVGKLEIPQEFIAPRNSVQIMMPRLPQSSGKIIMRLVIFASFLRIFQEFELQSPSEVPT